MLRRRKQGCFLLVFLVTLIYILGVVLRQSKTPAPAANDDADVGLVTLVTSNDASLTDAVDATWQPVAGTHNKFFVYSAFFERRPEQRRSVRVIGASTTRQKPPEKVWCVLHYDDRPTTYSVPARIRVIREHHNLKYSACFVLCPLGSQQAPPASVSVVSDVEAPPTNHLLVVDNLGNASSDITRGALGLCVKPIFNYNKTLLLVEFLELYRHLGVEHFTLYHRDVDADIGCLAQSYVDRGAVTWLGWQLELESGVEVRTQGLFSALNDCLYRNMYRYEHVVMVDLDEFIIPRGEETLAQLVKRLDKQHGASAGSYIFQNAWFYQTWPGVSSDEPLTSRLLTLSKTRRKTKLLPHKNRSKYICKPEVTVEVGNHMVWEHLKKVKMVNVKSDMGLSHHYRHVCEFGGDDCLKEPSQIDNCALKFTAPLVERVKRELELLKQECGVTRV